MRNILILSFMILTATAYGQSVKSDSAIKVTYSDKNNDKQTPAWFINGKLISNSLTTLNPNIIEDVNITKEDTLIDNIKYYGQIHIKTKSEYELKLITLNSLKDKYTDLGKKPVLFMIDGNVINADYDKYMVDENYILQIIVDEVKNEKEKIDFELIKLLTRSEPNIKKSKEIRIRGNEVSLNK